MDVKMRMATWRFILGAFFLMIFPFAIGQENEIDVEEPASKLENTVVSDMLRIVDHKFDTLTTRITALERAVSGLQFFSIRQFRQLSGNIQKTQKDFDNVDKKIGQLEVDGRGLKIAMSLLGRNVAELKSTSSAILGEVESSIGYVNENVDKRAEELKQQLEEALKKNNDVMEGHFAKQAEEAAKNKKTEVDKPFNCSVDFTDLAERIDTRFAEFKQQTYVHCAKLINDARQQQTEETRESEQEEETENLLSNESQRSGHPAAFSSSPEASFAMKRKEYLARKKLGVGSSQDENEVGYTDDEHDDRMMQLLMNMTTSVLQATSYFRHSSQVMEEILSNTGVMVREQSDIKNDLGVIKVSLYNRAGTSGNDARMFNNIPEDLGYSRHPKDVGRLYSPQWHRSHGLKECVMSASMLNGLESIARNSSQLLEVLTDLAQMSSVSMTKTTASLQDEVKRVESLRAHMATTVLSKIKEMKINPVGNVSKTTQRIFKMVEAVASNTGWLPLIFNNVQKTGHMVNRSLSISANNNDVLQKIHELQTTLGETSYPGGAEKLLDNRIVNVPPSKNDITDRHTVDSSTDTDSTTESHKGLNLGREGLQIIYRTSRKLNRIMPALTRLLAEPDPLITLVGGKQTDQGRLEIYNGGQWGTICHVDLNHREADAVCRHLGFAGGISAGAGHFGPGSGIAWTLNTSCLEPSATCPIVKQLEDVSLCDHDRDVALICDHMLRISSGNETKKNKIGRLEIHHKGLWLPICSEGWSGYSARVACQQMGFSDGREVEQGEWTDGANSTWLSKVACNGDETRLDACANEGWVEECSRSVPAGVRCL